ncbi:LIM domain-containing protein 1-like [Sinocyclocheilus rhinocerous]|uniref:LIM domain-containing protein 1-like n=1 Tax=Sinocyclocheilus rhinocerous TaxID=307959 RepID=UPI0007B8991B|nr:PREDICTED: LIM domain-containing protein 1-like [Sinocyclocheilus rhinocerous]
MLLLQLRCIIIFRLVRQRQKRRKLECAALFGAAVSATFKTRRGQELKGKAFYDFSGRVFCEEDYLYSSVKHFAEVCTSCGYLITDMVLQALGKSFHPDCFRCVICNEKLEGQPFSVDTQNKIYCVKDYHRILAQTCAICEQLILPTKGSNEIVRVMSMGKSYHVACYEGKSNI